MTKRKIIETIDLAKVYGMGDIKVAALKGVNVQIEAGAADIILQGKMLRAAKAKAPGLARAISSSFT